MVSPQPVILSCSRSFVDRSIDRDDHISHSIYKMLYFKLSMENIFIEYKRNDIGF
jgi:hypothetical protein